MPKFLIRLQMKGHVLLLRRVHAQKVRKWKGRNEGDECICICPRRERDGSAQNYPHCLLRTNRKEPRNIERRTNIRGRGPHLCWCPVWTVSLFSLFHSLPISARRLASTSTGQGPMRAIRGGIVRYYCQIRPRQTIICICIYEDGSILQVASAHAVDGC